jgi:hypothetical protein
MREKPRDNDRLLHIIEATIETELAPLKDKLQKLLE